MGKDLKGKELGVGISQRKDGKYTARFVSKRTGKTVQKYFERLQECRNWYADATFEDEHSTINALGNMTIDAWFEYWMENIKDEEIRDGTKNTYNYLYKRIKPYIGKKILYEVRPMDIQIALNDMKKRLKPASIFTTKALMNNFFESAFENELIKCNPVPKRTRTESHGKRENVLTRSDQCILLEASKKSKVYDQICFILQTGLRIGELSGLRFEDIDFESKVMHIQRSMNYLPEKGWYIGLPKTKSGTRDIPLTDCAIDILKKRMSMRNNRKVLNIQYANLVFLNNKGTPIYTTHYDRVLKGLCKKSNIPRISIHGLRHTFATRCIEAGMNPKILQSIMGHSNINITMNLYVHSTGEVEKIEMDRIQDFLNVV